MRMWTKIVNLLLILIFLIGTGISSQKNNISVESQSLDRENQTYNTPTRVNLIEIKNLVTVTKVIDGDTIEVENNIRVRMIGIDAPEVKSDECYEEESTKFLKSLIGNQKVELEKDISETDKYGRILRYVYKDGVLVNELMVARGYAKSSSYPPDTKYQKDFAEAERSARNQNMGLWKDCKTR